MFVVSLSRHLFLLLLLPTLNAHWRARAYRYVGFVQLAGMLAKITGVQGSRCGSGCPPRRCGSGASGTKGWPKTGQTETSESGSQTAQQDGSRLSRGQSRLLRAERHVSIIHGTIITLLCTTRTFSGVVFKVHLPMNFYLPSTERINNSVKLFLLRFKFNSNRFFVLLQIYLDIVIS